MKPLTLQGRVALWTASTTVLGLLLCCACIVGLTHREEMAELDAQLQNEAAGFFREWHLHGGPKFDFRADPEAVREWLSTIEMPRLVEVTQRGGRVLYRSASLKNDALHGLPLGLQNLDLDGMSWRYGGFDEDGIELRLTADVAPVQALSRTILLAFLVALPVLGLFLALSARWAARRALEPVRRITAAAEGMRAEQPGGGVPVPAPQDEIRRLAVVLNDAFARLQRSYEQAQRFSADASHELNTPLTIQRATIEALLDTPDLTDGQQEAVAGLLEQTRRLSSIMESLLLLSRADAGRLKLDFERATVSEILEACVEDARIVAEARGVEIETQVPAGLTATVDSGRLSQILVNLLDNAVKYNERGGRVRVEARSVGGRIEVEVKNTGPGIGPEQALHLFERFFRAQPFAESPGHGLGLSLSRELARAHGGDLRFVGSEAGWTEFRLEFSREQGVVG